MTISKSSASPIVVPLICMIHLMNTFNEFLCTTGVGLLCAVLTVSPFTKIRF